MATTNTNFKVKNGLDVTGALGVGSTPSYGTAGQVLTSGGIDVAPSWTTISSGGLSASSYVSQGRLTADTSVTPNADLVIPFVDDFDPQNWWDPTGKKFTPTTSGYYLITLQVWWTIAAVTNNQNNIQIRKNGNTVAINQTQTLSGNGYSQNQTKLVYLNGSTDYVDFTAYTGNSSAQSLQWGGNSNGQGTFFSASLITSGANTTSNALTFGTSGLKATSGTSPWNGSAAATIDIDTTKVPLLSGFQTFTGSQTFTSSANTIIPLIVSGVSGQAVDFFSVQDNTSNSLISVGSNGSFNVTSGSIMPMAGTSTEAPIDFSTGSAFVSSPVGGELEFDGSSLYISGNASTGPGRQVMSALQIFKLQATGSAIGTTAASAFGATNRPYLQANRLYRFRYEMRYGTKTTAGTITCSFVPSVTASQNIQTFAEVRVYGTGAAVTSGSFLASGTTASPWTAGTASGSVSNNATNVVVVVEGWIIAAVATRIDLQILNSAGSTAALTARSNFYFQDLGSSTASYGNFG